VLLTFTLYDWEWVRVGGDAANGGHFGI
jgi:hypothetical protein